MLCHQQNVPIKVKKKTHPVYITVFEVVSSDSDFAPFIYLPKTCSTPQSPQLYVHMPSITKTIKVRRTRHAGYCWRSRDELISDVPLWTPSYGRAKAGRPARTYVQQLCEDTRCSLEDLPEAMNDREEWRERVRDIRSSGKTWLWWWWFIFPLGVRRNTEGYQVADEDSTRLNREDGRWKTLLLITGLCSMPHKRKSVLVVRRYQKPHHPLTSSRITLFILHSFWLLCVECGWARDQQNSVKHQKWTENKYDGSISQFKSVQSTGTIKYTNCISTESKTPSLTTSVLDRTLYKLTVRFQ